jgi:hypothetical protein
MSDVGLLKSWSIYSVNMPTALTYLGMTLQVLTQYLNIGAADLIPIVELGQHNVIFNVPHLLLLLNDHDM